MLNEIFCYAFYYNTCEHLKYTKIKVDIINIINNLIMSIHDNETRKEIELSLTNSSKNLLLIFCFSRGVVEGLAISIKIVIFEDCHLNF